jgi:hypothetical protein
MSHLPRPGMPALAHLATLLALGAASLPALAVSPSECSAYAEGAVKDFETAIHPANAAKCNVPQTARWHPSLDIHYQWCLTVPTGTYREERNARDALLVRCGARVRLDQSR